MASKGELVIDECAYEPLAESARKKNWKTISMSPTDKGDGMKDEEMLKKYGKGRRTILTSDKTMYKQNPVEGGATAFVVHDKVGPDQIGEYTVKFDAFWESQTNKTLRGKRWRVPFNGDVTSEGLE